MDDIKQLFAFKEPKGSPCLHLKFISGPNKGKILKIDGTRMIFGSGAKSQVTSAIETNLRLSTYKYC